MGWRPDESEWLKRVAQAKLDVLQSPFGEVEEAYIEAGANALEEVLKANGQRVERGDTIRFFRNYEGVGMKQYYAFAFEAPNIVCSIPEEAGE